MNVLWPPLETESKRSARYSSSRNAAAGAISPNTEASTTFGNACSAATFSEPEMLRWGFGHDVRKDLSDNLSLKSSGEAGTECSWDLPYRRLCSFGR